MNVDQAKIHPLVLVPGFLATFPPVHGGELDPFMDTFSNTLAALTRAGYAPGATNTGATLIPFGYDWRRPISETGRFTLNSDIQSIANTFPVLRKPYADYSKVDLLAHSMGGLVSRAYIEDATTNNENTVHKLVTLATPHQGTLAAYRGWYGGDPDGILPDSLWLPLPYVGDTDIGEYISDPQFKALLGTFVMCKYNNSAPLIQEGYAIVTSQYYQYFRDEVPSAQDMLPPPSSVPAYLVSPTSTITYPDGIPYPYPTPPSPPPSLFLEDLNTPDGLFDVTKLQSFPITSSFSLAIPRTEGKYRVDPPPTPVDPNTPELWLYGQRNENNVVYVPGDRVVPNFSGNLADVPAVGGYSNIYPSDVTELSPNPRIDHMAIPNNPAAVRQILSYLTGIANIPETFWNVPYSYSISEQDRRAILACSMVRLQVTDPQGRRAGLDLTTGEVINEIPGAFVSAAGIEPQLIILPAIAGQYDVQGIGTGAGFYAMGALQITEDDNPFVLRMLTGMTTVGTTYNFTVTGSASPEPVYMPVIFKNSVGQTLAIPAPAQVIDSVFKSPLALPVSTPQPVAD